LPPRTPGLPLLGSLPALLRRPFDFLRDARARYGDIYRLDLGVAKPIVLNHPRHIQHVLIDNAKNYYKGGGLWDGVRAVSGNGLVVSEGDFWLRQRRLIQPHFHHKRLAALTAAMVEATTESLDEWQVAAGSVQPFDIQSAFGKLTMRVICRALFGQQLSRAELDAASVHASLIFDRLILSMVTSELPRWLPIPGTRRHRQAVAALDAIVYRLIANERAAATPSNSLLGMLVELVDETGTGMTDQQLRDEVITFFLAGYETTAATLAWLVHTLTQHPDALRAVEAELGMLLGERQPAIRDLMAMPYTHAVIQETLRLHAPSLSIPRTAAADDEIDGFRIPAGETVLLFVYGVHRNPDVWPDPERFDPGRFLGDTPADRHKHAWIPFGAGQRQCIGRDLSLMETQIVLAMLLQRFRIAAVPGRVVWPKLGATYVPNGLHVFLEPRQSLAHSNTGGIGRSAQGNVDRHVTL
jgi:cytochrome P450